VPSVLFTGYPGFLGSELLPRILRRSPNLEAACVVQPKFMALAEERRNSSPFADRIRLIAGDVTQPGLGSDMPSDVTEIFHLAAIYDLSVSRDAGMRVNVEGTRNILRFARQCNALERVHYVSTCYVSGRHRGVFREDQLQTGQTFNNFYEETKHLAEVEVRFAMREGLPATIYRPSVVVGDSTTGVTQKFDGPYFVMQWLMRQPRIAVLPVAGRPSRYRFNVVPRDFLVAALDHLSGLPRSRGKTYHLADPEPLTVDETINVIGEATGRTILRVPLPVSLAKGAIRYVPGVYRVMRIPATAVDYFVHPTLYDTTNAQEDLAGSGIALPRLRDYLPHLVDFVRAHPEIGSAAMA
jgi:nucleoside-diphosphate-sugar epimerase